jgi:3-oxoadipate enol-lactonase
MFDKRVAGNKFQTAESGARASRLQSSDPAYKQVCPSYQITGAGPLLVNIPGLDGTGELIFKQMPGLTQLYRVATFKLRDSRRFSYEDLAGDVAAIIRDAGEDRAIVVGESFGGTLALWFALLYPTMLDRLVIINSFPRFRNRFKIALARRFASWIPFQASWFVRVCGTTLGLRADGVAPEDRRRCFNIIRTVGRDGYVRRLELIEQLDLRDRLSEIKAPALFIAADRDLLLPSLREARFMASRIPNAKIEIARGAGHACLMGNRVSLASLLSNWMDEA